MFCKVITIDEDGHREALYQCDWVHRTFKEGEDFMLWLPIGDGIEMEFKREHFDVVQIFLMNDDGQTIDRHGWRKQ